MNRASFMGGCCPVSWVYAAAAWRIPSRSSRPVYCPWYVWKDMVYYYSENQAAKYAAKAIMPESASLTQNTNAMHPKARYQAAHSTQ